MMPCRLCTVPTDSGDLCAFCADYEPPTADAPDEDDHART